MSNNLDPNYNTDPLPARSGFVADVVAELRQVEWPTRQVVMRSFGIIIGICVVVSVFVAGVDFVLTGIMVKMGELI